MTPTGKLKRVCSRSKAEVLFAAGAIRAPEITLYRLSQAGDAHKLSESRHFGGKLVFQVR
jgi:hypothetical protein